MEFKDNIRNFEEDLKNSNNNELRESWINLFKKKFGEDCIITWKDELDIQKGFGTDVIIKTNKGRRYSIELKTRSNKCFKRDWIMEIVHHQYNNVNKEVYLGKKEGWIYSCTAEYIFHATLNNEGKKIIEAILYNVSPFKSESWKDKFNEFENLWLPTQFPNGTFQLTLNKLIPEQIIIDNVSEFWRWEDEIND